MHCGVPTASFAPFRASEAPPVYQPCPSPLSVPQKPLPCTNRVPHPFPYRRSPSRVPTMPLIPFRTAEAPPVYQPCPSPRSVPQKPLPCTNRAPHPFPYLRSPSCVPTVSSIPFRTAEAPPVYQLCPSPHLCRESTLFEPNSAHNIRRMAVICFCLRLRGTMSPLRTVSSQACDGSARWMNGSRSGVFVPDPTSEPCLNLSRHLARSRTLQSWLPV